MVGGTCMVGWPQKRPPGTASEGKARIGLGCEPQAGEHHGHGKTGVSLGAIREFAVDECQRKAGMGGFAEQLGEKLDDRGEGPTALPAEAFGRRAAVMQRCRPTAAADSLSGTTSDVLACKSWPLEAVCRRPPVWSLATTAACRCCSSCSSPTGLSRITHHTQPAVQEHSLPASAQHLQYHAPEPNQDAHIVLPIDKTLLPAANASRLELERSRPRHFESATRAPFGDAVEPRSCHALHSRCHRRLPMGLSDGGCSNMIRNQHSASPMASSVHNPRK